MENRGPQPHAPAIWKRNKDNRIGCIVLFSGDPWSGLPNEIKNIIATFSDDLVCIVCGMILTEETGYHTHDTHTGYTFFGHSNMMIEDDARIFTHFVGVDVALTAQHEYMYPTDFEDVKNIWMYPTHDEEDE